ncbi:uncharacterized protein LY79DRAFT_563595 [Colletotrichum navitas]|uniref:Uncharacterized protein n=1 Tax=Colletotrichum navitas TaxID=681940 RepID=A0AAD8V2F7_9PEZI|nr:uncharacterized protein LY79DRAFT_563595 [Colletotrichum navitas]KAK1579684.1 hypothetical protein LY79DRAFT_563595 [Colletotrichum navitas]
MDVVRRFSALLIIIGRLRAVLMSWLLAARVGFLLLNALQDLYVCQTLTHLNPNYNSMSPFLATLRMRLNRRRA